jgi:cobalt-zinc-cadmium efflux system membrane fusion protein
MFRTRLSLLILNLALAGCGGASNEAAEPEKAPEPAAAADTAEVAADQVTLSAAEQQAAGLRIGRVEVRPLGTGLAVNGTLDVPPESAVSITAPLAALWITPNCSKERGCARARCWQ